MTTPRRDPSTHTPFGAWLQGHPELDLVEYCLSATDFDQWIHRYAPRRERYSDIRQTVEDLMLVEIKCFNAAPQFAQRDTLSVVDLLLRLATTRPDGRRRYVKLRETRPERGPWRWVRCFGVHLLQLSGDFPAASEAILWDGKWHLQEWHLIEVLRFERDPDDPRKMLSNRRHHLRPQREQTLPLLKLIPTPRP